MSDNARPAITPPASGALKPRTRRGCFVVLLGPDGSGKSSVARELMSCAATAFYGPASLHLHWKPRILPGRPRSGLGAVVDPHGRPPRNRLLSLAFFSFHWLDFALGSYWQIGRAVRRGGLVVVERYYYDFLVDRQRYRLRLPDWLVRWGAAPLRKPDRVFLLDVDPATLQRRKQEVAPEESAQQRAAYRELVQWVPCGRVIDANRPIQEIVDQIKREIAP